MGRVSHAARSTSAKATRLAKRDVAVVVAPNESKPAERPSGGRKSRGKDDRVTITLGQGGKRKLHAMARAEGTKDAQLASKLVKHVLYARLARRAPTAWPGEAAAESTEQPPPPVDRARGFLGATGYELALASVDDRVYAVLDRESRDGD